MQVGVIGIQKERIRTMTSREAFAKALKQARAYQGLTQEDFSDVSSRTYISTLERGLKSPTLEKIDELAATLELHPLTILTLTYLAAHESQKLDSLLKKVQQQVAEIIASS